MIGIYIFLSLLVFVIILITITNIKENKKLSKCKICGSKPRLWCTTTNYRYTNSSEVKYYYKCPTCGNASESDEEKPWCEKLSMDIWNNEQIKKALQA